MHGTAAACSAIVSKQHEGVQPCVPRPCDSSPCCRELLLLPAMLLAMLQSPARRELHAAALLRRPDGARGTASRTTITAGATSAGLSGLARAWGNKRQAVVECNARVPPRQGQQGVRNCIQNFKSCKCSQVQRLIVQLLRGALQQTKVLRCRVASGCLHTVTSGQMHNTQVLVPCLAFLIPHGTPVAQVPSMC